MFIRKLILFLALSVSSFTQAGEEKKEEKPEGGKAEEKKAVPEWMELQTQLSSLDGKIQQKKESIQKLIEEKQELPANSAQIKTVIDEMVAQHKELQKLAEEYEKKETILKFRFPEKALEGGRSKEATEVKPLEQMEQDLGIDGRLTRNQKRSRSQYQVKPPEGELEGKDAKKKEDHGGASIEDQKPILIQK